MKKFKPILQAAIFLTALTIPALLTAVLPDRQISQTERRPLAEFPSWTIKSFLDKSYMTDLETALLDHFPARDAFRTVKAEAETNLLGKQDANGYYRTSEGIFQIQNNYSGKHIRHAAQAFEAIAQEYFPESDCYYAVIPDKSFYRKENTYPSLDQEDIQSILKENMPSITPICLEDRLSIEDYYRTDLHWRQECLPDVADFLLASMGITGNGTENGKQLELKVATDNFDGAYAAASAFLTEPDTIRYYEDSMIASMQVYDYEKKEYVSVYAPERLGETDDYDFFLWGARALLTIENAQSETDRKLLIFRDSFAGSLAPLLAEKYKTTTLVDLRYVSVSHAMELLSDTSYEDVLFLYSADSLNNSDSLRIYFPTEKQSEGKRKQKIEKNKGNKRIVQNK